MTGSSDAFEEVFVKPGPDAIKQFEQFNAQLPDGNIMHLVLLRRRNVAVARRLRERREGERIVTWNVICAEPNMDVDLAEHASSGEAAGDPIKDMSIETTFLSKNEAEQWGKHLIEELQQEAGAGAQVTWAELEIGYHWMVMHRRTSYARVVMVRMDDGSIH